MNTPPVGAGIWKLHFNLWREVYFSTNPSTNIPPRVEFETHRRNSACVEKRITKKFLFTYGYTQDPFKNRSQNFKPKIKESYPQYLERENKKIALYAVIHLHCAKDCEKRFKPKESNDHIHNRINVTTLKIESEKQNSDEFSDLQYYCVREVNGAMKTSSVEFISRSPTPSPMNSKYRRFVLLRKIFQPWQWKRRKKRNRFEQTSRTLERKISMRSTKDQLVKKTFSSGLAEKGKRDVPLRTAYSQAGRLWQPKTKQSSRAGAAKVKQELKLLRNF
ncbi:phosphatase and actin regulator 2 [Trichonephila clavipes]|nr:phosphatase and actin regulator 2 [Trichonephila clavipes]